MAAATRKLVSVPTDKLEEIVERYARDLFDTRLKKNTWECNERVLLGSNEDGFIIAYLRDLFFPCFERMVYELVFGIQLEESRNRLMTRSAENVINGVKGIEMRDMKARRELCDLLIDLLESASVTAATDSLDGSQDASASNPNEISKQNAVLLQEALSDEIGREEWALFLQGVFFTTGAVQLSEGMSHVAQALAQHPQVSFL